MKIIFCELNKTKKTIKIKRRKEKEIRKYDANHGGVWPFWRCIGSSLAQQIPSPFDFLWLRMEWLNSVHGGPPFIAFRWIIMHMWQASMWSCMVGR